MVLFLSNTHHISCDKVSFVMILASLRASAGEPFYLVYFFLGSLSEVWFSTTFERNRVTAKAASNSESRGVRCGVPRTMTQNRPQNPGTPRTCRQESQTGVKDYKGTA